MTKEKLAVLLVLVCLGEASVRGAVVGDWCFNDGTSTIFPYTASDSSGNGRTLTSPAAEWGATMRWVAGPSGTGFGAVRMEDGYNYNKYFAWDDAGGSSFKTLSGTIKARVKYVPTNGVYDVLIRMSDTVGVDGNYTLSIDQAPNAGKPVFSVWASSYGNSITSNIPLPTNQWADLQVSWNWDSVAGVAPCNMWIDGQLVAYTDNIYQYREPNAYFDYTINHVEVSDASYHWAFFPGEIDRITVLDNGLSESVVMEEPVFSVGYGVISGPRLVTITCATPNATIRYTTDGNEPTEASPIYGSPVPVDNNVTLKARAWAGGYFSDITSVTYTIASAYNRPAAITKNDSISVDGNLTEWREGDFVPLDKNYDYNGATDVAGAYYAAKWSTSGKIYVAVKVRDTAHKFTETYTGWDARDAVEVYLHTQGTRGGYDGTWETAQQYMAGIKDGTTDQLWTSLSATGSVPAELDFQAAGRVEGQWLYYEFALTPFDYFGGLAGNPSTLSTLSENDVVGLDVCVVGNDGQTSTPGYTLGYTGMKAENTMGGKYGDWTHFGLHKLTATISGDANLDGKVDVSDLGILAANYGTTSGATWDKGDFNNDGKVDVSDLGILAANYGTGSGAALDFNADVRTLGLTVEAKEETPTILSGCAAAGLPLVTGIVLAGLMLGGLKMRD